MLIALLLLLISLIARAGSWLRSEALEHCKGFDDLYEGIREDLKRWPDGIER